jgi:hypothetical protein
MYWEVARTEKCGDARLARPTGAKHRFSAPQRSQRLIFELTGSEMADDSMARSQNHDPSIFTSACFHAASNSASALCPS